MAKQAYARRYAQAVFEIALERKELDRWRTDLTKMTDMVRDAAVRAAMTSPRFSLETKPKLIEERLSDVNPLARNLLQLLITRDRLEMIEEIAAEYGRLLNRHRGIKQAEVITATPLEDEDRKKLAEKLEAIIGSKVVLESRVDPSVLGGFIARINGSLLDASTRSNLLALKKELGGTGG